MEENITNQEEQIVNNIETSLAPESAAPVAETEKCECKSEKKCSCKCLPIVNCILLVGLILLYIFHFTGIGAKSHSLVNADAKQPVVSGEGGLTIAYINTDTLMAKYQYAIDLQKQLQDFQSAKESSYKQQISQFQKDYEAYIKNGGENMTLSQQQAKEKELQERSQRLQSLEAQYAQEVAQKTLTESEKMTHAVYNFIRDYNAQNQKFTLILSRSFSSSPILYGDEGMDITDEIVKGLNDEYAKVKADEKK